MSHNKSFQHSEAEQAANRQQWNDIAPRMYEPGQGHHKKARAKNRTARKSRKANRK